MSEADLDRRFLKRAELFAWLSGAGAVIVLILAAVGVWQRASGILSIDMLRPHITILDFAARFANSGIPNAARILAAGAVTIVAIRLASSREVYWWAKTQDAAFLHKATVFARGAEVFAWVTLALSTISLTGTVWNMSSIVAEAHLPDGVSVDWRRATLVEAITHWIGSEIWGFLALILAAYILRAMVLIAARAADGDHAAESEEPPNA